MISCIISLLIFAIVLAIVYWAGTAILGAFGVAVPGQILKLISVLLVLLLLLYFLQCLFGAEPGWRPHGWKW